MSVPAVVFLAPPTVDDPTEGAFDEPFAEPFGEPVPERMVPASAGPGGLHRQGPQPGPAAGGGLPMTRGAREAATGMKISEEQLRHALAEPDEIGPDPSRPGRMRVRRGNLTLVTGADGMLLRVARGRR